MIAQPRYEFSSETAKEYINRLRCEREWDLERRRDIMVEVCEEVNRRDKSATFSVEQVEHSVAKALSSMISADEIRHSIPGYLQFPIFPNGKFEDSGEKVGLKVSDGVGVKVDGTRIRRRNISSKVRDELAEMQGFRCGAIHAGLTWGCRNQFGEQLGELSLRYSDCDHIDPLRYGGPDVYSNMQMLCKTCHAFKSAMQARKLDSETYAAKVHDFRKETSEDDTEAWDSDYVDESESDESGCDESDLRRDERSDDSRDDHDVDNKEVHGSFLSLSFGSDYSEGEYSFNSEASEESESSDESENSDDDREVAAVPDMEGIGMSTVYDILATSS